MNQDQLFEAVRDGSFTEAKEALSKLDVSWRHSQLRQNVLFFIAARQRRGSERLGTCAVRMGFDLADVDVSSASLLCSSSWKSDKCKMSSRSGVPGELA